MKQANRRSSQSNGKAGEVIAQAFLEAQGYILIDANVHFGKTSGVTGELDIVAWDGPTLCFVEVKTRQSVGAELIPAAAVTPRKQQQITRLATLYALQNGLLEDGETSFRFDVVSVMLGSSPLSRESGAPTVELIRGAFLAAEDVSEV